MDLETLHFKWTEATARLNPGEQRVFHDVLTLVESGQKTNLVYGADYSDDGKGACLVYATSAMLSSAVNEGEGSSGFPMRQFSEVVSLYDQINREYLNRDINTNQYVSPLAAEILLHHYAPLKPMPMETIAKESHFKDDQAYVEPTDQEMLEDLITALSEAPVENYGELPFDVPTPFVDLDYNENV